MNNLFQKYKEGYFEGWYLKHQTAEQTVALIPSHHIDKRGNRSTSIQVITQRGSHRFEFPSGLSVTRRDKFYVSIGDNVFSEKGIRVDLSTDGFSVSGELRYGPLAPLASPAMGPLRFVPRLQCSHEVVSMSHSLQGTLYIDGQPVDFSGGTGYIETDRGSSFPSSYLWTQCNRFEEDCSVMIAGAWIPLGSARFMGGLGCVFWKGWEYRFATYRGAKIERYCPQGIVLRQGGNWLSARLLDGDGYRLLAPEKGTLRRTIWENPACRVRYRLMKEGRMLFDLVSDRAGFEYVAEDPSVFPRR